MENASQSRGILVVLDIFLRGHAAVFEKLPFLHLQERFGPDVTDFTFGTGRRDP
jgi:hypothetical protein